MVDVGVIEARPDGQLGVFELTFLRTQPHPPPFVPPPNHPSPPFTTSCVCAMASRSSTIRSVPLLLSLGSRLVRAAPMFAASSAAVVVAQGHHNEEPMNRAEYISKLAISFALVIIGGIFAG